MTDNITQNQVSVETGLAGPLITLSSATFFAFNTPLATFFYADGGNSSTLVLVRLIAAVFITGLLILFLKKMPRISKRKLPALFAFSACVFGQGFCYLGSVAYIPVSLAVLLLYTWPIVVAIASPLIGEKRPGVFQIICFVIAFFGLLITFGPSIENLDPRGLVLALLGACFTVGLILISRVILKTEKPLTVCFYSNAIACVLAAFFLPFTGGYVMAASSEGVLALALVCIVFAGAVITQLFALRITRASVSAMIYNMEPVISIGIALALLGETLTPSQTAGGLLVVGALLAYTRPPKRF